MPRLGIATSSTKHHFSAFSWHFSHLHPTMGLHAIVRYSARVVALGVALATNRLYKCATAPTNARRKLSAGFVAALKTPPRHPPGLLRHRPAKLRRPVQRDCEVLHSYTRGYRAASAPTRLALGDAAKMSLAVARKKAREWLDLIEQGKDPREVERQAKAEAQRRQRTTFAAVAEDFIAHKLPSERGGRKIECAMRRDLLPIWSAKPITEITEADVLVLVRAKKAKDTGSSAQLAHACQAAVRLGDRQRSYGLTISPCANLRASKIIGERPQGERTLTDDRAFRLVARGGAIGLSIHRGLSCFVADWLTFKRSGRCKLGRIRFAQKEMDDPGGKNEGPPGQGASPFGATD